MPLRNLLILSSLIIALLTPAAGSETSKTRATVDPVYQLSPFDLLTITVYGQGDLTSEQRITDKGSISMPLLGELIIGGMTVSSAQKRIESAFIEQEYLVKPVVTISIKEFSPKVVTVLGEVTSPGSIEIPNGRNGLPIQIAIAQAGGLPGAAAKSDVKVRRAHNDGDASRSEGEVVNVSAILEASGQGKTGKSYLVMPDDIIFVPRRLF